MLDFGISVYNGLEEYTIEKNLQYLKEASLLGYTMVFSSAHISEAEKDKNQLQQLIDETNRLKMKLVLDVSKPMFQTFEKPNDLYCYRLDYGFSDEDIVEMSKTLSSFLELNASTISEEHLDALVNLGVNLSHLRLSFNFYPKRHTGHSIDFVRQKVKMAKKYGLPITIFVPSFHQKRAPMYEGLPTIEQHRTQDLSLSIEECKSLGVDGIIFGDCYASTEELKMAIAHNTDYLEIPLHLVNHFPTMLEENISGVFHSRPDTAEEMIRVSSTRGKNSIEAFHTTKREVGDVTMDNDLFKRYRGEINIILKPLEKDDRVNVIGQLDVTLPLLRAMNTGFPFKFKLVR
jgi:hypothetical protein